jgi:hypothetical protein
MHVAWTTRSSSTFKTAAGAGKVVAFNHNVRCNRGQIETTTVQRCPSNIRLTNTPSNPHPIVSAACSQPSKPKHDFGGDSTS